MASEFMPAKAAKAFGIDLKEVNVRIYPQNTGAPVFESEGGVASVTRIGAGSFLITLNSCYLKLRDAQVSYRDERDTADLYAQLGAVSNEAGGSANPITIVVKLKTGAANTDVAAGAGAHDRAIYCTFTFEDSTT